MSEGEKRYLSKEGLEKYDSKLKEYIDYKFSEVLNDLIGTENLEKESEN